MDEELIARFRLVTGVETVDINDDDLSSLLEANEGDINLTTAAFFDRQATRYSKFTDVSESGSSRSLGSLYKAASAMADSYRKRVGDAGTGGTGMSGRTRTRLIVRAEA